jgi:hypothetical protein
MLSPFYERVHAEERRRARARALARLTDLADAVQDAASSSRWLSARRIRDLLEPIRAEIVHCTSLLEENNDE